MDKTFVMIKPDAVSRDLAGEIIRRFETGGLKVRALKMLRLSKTKAEKLYSIHRTKPFFDELVEFVTSGPVVVMVLQAPDAVERVRQLMGATDPAEAEQGTIRGDFAESITKNMVHGADSKESAEREIPIFFSEEEIVA